MTDTAVAEIVVEVGDIFEYSWGYDQTNVDYFEVVEITPSGKSVRLREIAAGHVEGSGGFMSDRTRPLPGRFLSDKVFLKRLYKTSYQYLSEGSSPWRVNFDFSSGDHIPKAKAADSTTYRSWYA